MAKYKCPNPNCQCEFERREDEPEVCKCPQCGRDAKREES